MYLQPPFLTSTFSFSLLLRTSPRRNQEESAAYPRSWYLPSCNNTKPGTEHSALCSNIKESFPVIVKDLRIETVSGEIMGRNYFSLLADFSVSLAVKILKISHGCVCFCKEEDKSLVTDNP